MGEDTACVGFGPRLPHLLDAPTRRDRGRPGRGRPRRREIDRQWVHAGDPVYDTWLRQRLDDLADTLSEAGVPVVWATSPHVRLAPAGGGATGPRSTTTTPPGSTGSTRSSARWRPIATTCRSSIWAPGHNGSRGASSAPAQRAEGRDLTEDGAGRRRWLVPALFEVLGIAPWKWNHNLHHHPLVLRTPAGPGHWTSAAAPAIWPGRCGRGPPVTALDRDALTLDRAAADDGAGVAWVLGDLSPTRSCPQLDLVAVATPHHDRAAGAAGRAGAHLCSSY